MSLVLLKVVLDWSYGLVKLWHYWNPASAQNLVKNARKMEFKKSTMIYRKWAIFWLFFRNLWVRIEGVMAFLVFIALKWRTQNWRLFLPTGLSHATHGTAVDLDLYFCCWTVLRLLEHFLMRFWNFPFFKFLSCFSFFFLLLFFMRIHIPEVWGGAGEFKGVSGENGG